MFCLLQMRTRPFIRTLEFLWQEGHTAHATGEEAEARAIEMIDCYRRFAEEVAAMPVVVGRKSRVESFAGADCTVSVFLFSYPHGQLVTDVTCVLCTVHDRGDDGRQEGASGGNVA